MVSSKPLKILRQTEVGRLQAGMVCGGQAVAGVIAADWGPRGASNSPCNEVLSAVFATVHQDSQTSV